MKLFKKIKSAYKKFIFNQFIKYSNEFIDNTESVVFSMKVMRKEYEGSFFPVKEISVKKDKIKYTLLVSADGRVFNLSRHDMKEIISEKILINNFK